MKNSKTLLISTVLLAQSVLATPTIEDHFETIATLSVSSDNLAKLKRLEKNHRLPVTRPAFCPLNNTESYKKTVESLKALTTVFADDCFDKNQSLVGQILESSKSLENDLNELSKQKDDSTDTESEENKVKTLSEVEVDGIPVAQIMEGMDSLFNRGKCSNLDRDSFLVKSADVIQTFSQIGLYSESGAKYAFGGLAVSSILRFLNNLLEERFQFEKEEDIKTFAKLNCAYYDIRNEVKSQEVFYIDTSLHYKDKVITERLVQALTTKYELYTKSLVEIEKLISKNEEEFVKSVGMNLEKLIKPLAAQVPDRVIDQPGKSAKYQQAEVLGLLAYNLDMMNSALDDYLNESTGPDRFLNLLFKQKLNMVSEPEFLMNLSVKEFNEQFLYDISSSFNRVVHDIAKRRDAALSEYSKNVIISFNDKEYTVKEVREHIKSKKQQTAEKEFTEFFNKVQTIDGRLERFVNRNEYSSEDSSNGGVREIVQLLDVAKNHVYGKFGNEFLKSVKERANDQKLNFRDKVVNIQEKYLDVNGKYSTIKPKDELNIDEIRNACVDAQTAREIWVYAQSLSELGYDFLSTNSDIFGDPEKVKDRKSIKKHDESTRLARRIISAENYKKKYNNYLELGEDSIEFEGENIPMSNALQVIDSIDFFGVNYTIDQAKEYLNENYGSVKGSRNYLGPVILGISAHKPRAIFLQELYEEYSCDNLSTMSR